MPNPFDNLETLAWRPLHTTPGAVTRPVAGAEAVLDQVRRLNEGMNDLLGCIRVSYTLPRSILEERISEAWLRMRFYSPLIAAEIIHDKNPEQMGSWVYKPADLDAAKEWREATLQYQQVPNGQLEKDFIEDFIQEKLSVPLPYGEGGGLLFYCYVLLEEKDNKGAILLHAAHTILDGPALMDCFDLLLEQIMEDENSKNSIALKWGSEIQNLPPHPVELFGGTLDGWDTEGMGLLEEIDRLLGDELGSHTIRPRKTVADNPGRTRKVLHIFGEKETSKIITRIKSLESTITVTLEAAHVLATLSLRPPPTPDGRTVLFPSIIALRHRMKAPWNRRETLVVTGAAVPIIALHTPIQDTKVAKTEREKMILLMKDFRAQYSWWMSSPHHVFIVPAQTAMNPIRHAISNADAEITNLGIVEKRLNVVWNGRNAGEKLVVDDFHLGLRRPAPVLMTHVWTFGGCLRIQCQGTDAWDVNFMQQFLDEIVRFMRTISD